MKRCGTSCDELDLPCRVVLKAAWDQRHMIHHVIGFIQIPGSLPIINYTLCFRIMKSPCLRCYPTQRFCFSLYKNYFLIKDTTLIKGMRARVYLAMSLPSHIYSPCPCRFIVPSPSAFSAHGFYVWRKMKCCMIYKVARTV